MSTNDEKEAERAAGWQTLLDFGKANDDKTLSEWKDELANLLTFTGLFSAVVTGFIVIAIPLLQEDSAEKSARLLAQISLQLSSFRMESPFLNSTAPFDPELSAPFEPDKQTVQINILWFASLTITLMTSFFTIAAQQWLRCIPLPPHLTTREAVRLRRFRQDGLISWKVPTIISLLPVIVQIAVVLFLAGLLLLLDSINSTVANVFAILGGSFLGLFVIMVFIPVVVKNCPYKTPVIPTFVALAQFCAVITLPPIFLACWVVGGALSTIVIYLWNFRLAFVRFVRSTLKKPPRTRVPTGPSLAIRHNTIGDAFFLSCGHIASIVIAHCFSNTGQFWLSRELPIASDKSVDYDALSDAPKVVPKGKLHYLLSCIDELCVDQRLKLTETWIRHMLDLTAPAELLLSSHLHAPTYTGILRHAPSSMFLQLRETLWRTLPEAWDCEKHHRRNFVLSLMLCLLFRGLPEEPVSGDGFPQEFGERVFAIRDSQTPEDVIYNSKNSSVVISPIDVNAVVIPTSLLFHCCQRGFSLRRDQIIAASKWASSLHNYLMNNVLINMEEELSHRSSRSSLMRIEELAVTSIAIAIQPVARDARLLADNDMREAIEVMLKTSAEIIPRLRLPLINYTRHITAMSPGTHILACNQAIENIADSLFRLAEGAHIARTSDGPSRTIMAEFRAICSANWGDAFAETRAYIDEYDTLNSTMEALNSSEVV